MIKYIMPSGGGNSYGWVLPVGGLALGAVVLNKLGILKFSRDATAEVVIDKKKLNYEPAFYKNNADLLYNNMNAYVTNAGNILKVLALFKTAADRKLLYKEFGKKTNTSNLGVLDVNIGQPKDLKQWLLDYHTTKFDNKFVIDWFKNAGL